MLGLTARHHGAPVSHQNNAQNCNSDVGDAPAWRIVSSFTASKHLGEGVAREPAATFEPHSERWCRPVLPSGASTDRPEGSPSAHRPQ